MGRSPWGERPDFRSVQITSPLNGLVNFLKSLNADVCELTSPVGSKLRAHSGLRKMETWKSLRMMSDKANVFDTVSIWILSLALEFVTPRSYKEFVTPRTQSLSLNWVFLRKPSAPTVKLACVQFQGRPCRALR